MNTIVRDGIEIDVGMSKQTKQSPAAIIGYYLIMFLFIVLILNAVGVEFRTWFPTKPRTPTAAEELDRIKLEEEIQETIERHYSR